MKELTNRAEITRGSNRTLLFLVVNRGHICVRWMNPMRPSSVGFAIPTPPAQPPQGYPGSGGWAGGVGRQSHQYWMNPMRPVSVGGGVPSLYSSLPDKPPKGRCRSGNPGRRSVWIAGSSPGNDNTGTAETPTVPNSRTIYFSLSKLFSNGRARIFPPDANKTFWRYGP